MHIPAFDDLALDAELSSTPMRVYALLVTRLDVIEYRPIKQWAVAHELKIHRNMVSSALRKLVDRGYLAEGKCAADGAVNGSFAKTYRLVFTARKAA